MKKVLALMLMIAPFSVNAAEHGGKAVKSKATAAQAAEDAQQIRRRYPAIFNSEHFFVLLFFRV